VRHLDVRVELVELIHDRVGVGVHIVEQLCLGAYQPAILLRYIHTFAMAIAAVCALSWPSVMLSMGASPSPSRGRPSPARPGPEPSAPERGRWGTMRFGSGTVDMVGGVRVEVNVLSG
jgi:hypothetical protein